MSTIRLLIARHGETEYNRKGLLQGRGIDAPLNETGRMQAVKLSGYLEPINASAVICSSMKRAIETAEPISVQKNLSLSSDKRLDEMDFGNLEGSTISDVNEELNRLHDAWKNGDTGLKIPGGESPEEVLKRAQDAIQPILIQQNGGSIIMILHGRLIRILLSVWLGLGLKNMHKIEHQNAAVNEVVFDGKKFEAVYLNKVDHLG